MTYIVKADVEKRISAAVLAQIFHDDSGDAALNAFLADAEAMIEARIAKVYGIAGLTAVRALGTSAPRLVKKLCLDALEVNVGMRHPEYIRGDWEMRYEWLMKELDRLQLREIQLDTAGAPEPGVTDGADVHYTDPDEDTMPDKLFADGLGIF